MVKEINNMNEKMKHRKFIQNIITKMNTNSFQLKGITITIIAAFAAVYATTENTVFLLIVIFLALVSWFLDTYYLQQERKFRGICDDVAEITNNFKIKLFEMPINNCVGGKYNYFNVFR